MAKYRHKLFEMYDFHNEARDALASKEVMSLPESTAWQDAKFSLLEISQEAGITVIKFQSPASAEPSMSPDYREDFATLAAVLSRNSKVIFDFTGVEKFGPASIDALGNLSHTLRNKGSRIVLCCLQPEVKEAFFPAKL